MRSLIFLEKAKSNADEPNREESDTLLKKLSNGESIIRELAIRPGKLKNILWRKLPKRWESPKKVWTIISFKSDLAIDLDSTSTSITMKKWEF